MRVRFTKPLKIALDGRNVVSYAAGDVLDEPHPDILGFPDFFAVVDEVEARAEAAAARLSQVRAALADARAQVRGLEMDLLSLEPTRELEPIDVFDAPAEDPETEILDEGTKDERIVKKKARR